MKRKKMKKANKRKKKKKNRMKWRKGMKMKRGKRMDKTKTTTSLASSEVTRTIPIFQASNLFLALLFHFEFMRPKHLQSFQSIEPQEDISQPLPFLPRVISRSVV